MCTRFLLYLQIARVRVQFRERETPRSVVVFISRKRRTRAELFLKLTECGKQKRCIRLRAGGKPITS